MSRNVNEDSVSSGYKYSWDSQSDLPLKEYLKKFRPSMVQNDGTKPWIWVTGKEFSKTGGVEAVAREMEAIETGTELLNEITAKVESIKNDSSIPIRSNKKTGAKSKKEVREEVQLEATTKLKDIAQKSGYVQGKWLLFAPAEKVDMIWSSLTTSLVEGALANTPAYSAKVATSPENETPNYQHIICLYLPNVYDKDAVTKVMKILLREHGFNLSGVKSDLYTVLGIDSKHPSGIQSTTWKNKDLMKEEEMKALKDAFFAGLKAEQSTEAKEKPVEATKEQDTTAKPKPKLKKKVQDNPFASDDEGNTDDEEKKRKEEVSKRKQLVKKRVKDDDSKEEEERPKKRAVKSKS